MNMQKSEKHKEQGGFSLVELMIAMLLGLILMIGVINVFLSSSQTYRLQEAMFRVQESGRFALDIMARDLRDAGFQNVIPALPSRIIFRDLSIQAVEGLAPAAPLPAGVLATVTSEILRIPANGSVSGGGVAYYVAPDAAAGNVSALFRNGNAVVEGVEGLNIQYGVDTSGDREADTYLARAAVGAGRWQDVVAVRLNVLVASDQPNVVETAQAAPALFPALNTADRRLYQVFTTTIALRNKMK